MLRSIVLKNEEGKRRRVLGECGILSLGPGSMLGTELCLSVLPPSPESLEKIIYECGVFLQCCYGAGRGGCDINDDCAGLTK